MNSRIPIRIKILYLYGFTERSKILAEYQKSNFIETSK